MTDVLNPTLYAGLVRLYGRNSIEIVSPGEAIEWSLRKEMTADGSWRVSRVVEHSGEEYRLRCPYCKDHRPRLYVSHRFGVWDKRTGSDNLWLAQCFNESCFSDHDNRKIFLNDVYRIPVARRRTIRVAPGKPVGAGGLREIAPPGPMWRLDELAKNQPNHHAIQYLESRNFDPTRMGKLWGVAYCPRAHVYSLASDKLILPVYWKGVMVGWQARYIGDDVRGVPFNVAGVAKYWSSPGFKRSRAAYNFWRAVQHPTVVIVEGMTDVWRTGMQATCGFGKTFGAPLQKLLLEEMASRHSPKDAVIVLMLDPKKDPKDKVHHIEKLYAQLRARGAPVRVLPVYLPVEMDPGGSERSWLWSYMREKGRAAGIPVSFRKPK